MKNISYGWQLTVVMRTYLGFGSDVEEGPISCNEMVSNTSGLVLNDVRICVIRTLKDLNLQSRQFGHGGHIWSPRSRSLHIVLVQEQLGRTLL
jgi:hypothetical protein